MLGSQDAYPAIDLGCDLAHTFSSSRRELALSPTCQPRQGGFHKSGMRPIESANVAEAPAFAEFVEEAQ